MSNVIIKPGDKADAGLGQSVVGWSSGNMDDPNDGLRWAPLAQETLQTLVKHYPGYDWFVEVNGGMLIIRNYTLDWKGKWCMAVQLNEILFDAGVQQRTVVRRAGEFLERANMKRGKRPEGETAMQLDGATKWSKHLGT